MTTTTAAQPTTAFRLFEVEVAHRRRLSPAFVRFTFTGDDLDAFADNGFDQRIKLVLPLPSIGVGLPTGADWLGHWRQLPDDRRNPIRTYTVRAVRQQQREVDVDVVLHGESGPASRWASQAGPGDPLAIVGPNAAYEGDCGGIEFDASATGLPLLLAGDETAVPAVAAILERLPLTARGTAVLEVPEPADMLDLTAPDGVTVTWLPRLGTPHGTMLTSTVKAAAARLVHTPRAREHDLVEVDDDTELVWDVPEVDRPALSGAASATFYAWLAGEAGVITGLRRHLVREPGVDRRSVAFMGYWKLGRAES